jgi:hypothetical protein
MASLADIIRRTRGTAGSNGAWRVERDPDGSTATLWHYSTAMLSWNVERPSDPTVLDWSIGHGSVSDQGGMNQAFRVLGLPYRFDRDARAGGPRITELTRHPCGCVTDPSVSACSCREAAATREAATLDCGLSQLAMIGPAPGADLPALVYGQEV